MAGIDDFNQIKNVITTLDSIRPARFGYTQQAIDAVGSAEVSALTGVYAQDDSTRINSIPTPELIAVDPMVMEIGLRTQAATVSRLTINHFFGRLGLNLLKLTEKVRLLVENHLVNRYITPSGKIVEDLAVSYNATTVTLTKHQSPLAASAPTTEATTLTIPAAVYNASAGVMTANDKMDLDDTKAGLNALNGETVKKTGDQTIAGIKTFTSIPVLPSSNPVSDNEATRKAYVDELDGANVKKTGDQTIAGIKTFSSIPSLPPNDPVNANDAVRKSYADNSAVPVGAIIAYLPGYFTNVGNAVYTPVALSLPSSWKVCDGTFFYDSESPLFNFNGRYLPNLSDSRFLMGNTVAFRGTVGANTTNTISIDINQLPYHNHSNSHEHTSAGTVNSGNATHSHQYYRLSNVSLSATNGIGPLAEALPKGTWSSLFGVDMNTEDSMQFLLNPDTSDSPNASHSHTFTGSATTGGPASTGYAGTTGIAISILPKYLSVSYIMRVK